MPPTQKIIGITALIFAVVVFVSAARLQFYENKNIQKPSENSVPINTPKASVPELVKQLYETRIPKEFLSTKEFVSLKDGRVEVRGPQILEDGTADKDGPQDLLHRMAYLKDNAYVISDFNKDGLEDVAIVVVSTGGGSGTFYHLVVFVNEKGKLQYKSAQYLGDRVRVNSIVYKNGIFSVDLITQGPDEGFCCGTLRTVFEYTYTNGEFIEKSS